MSPTPQMPSTSTPTPKSPATGLMITLFAVVILGMIAQYAMSALSDASRAKESAMLSSRMTSLEKAVGDLSQKTATLSPAVQQVATTPATEQGVWSPLDVSSVSSFSAFESRFPGLRSITDLSKPFTLKPGETVRLMTTNPGGSAYLYLTMKMAPKPFTAPLDVVAIQVGDDGKMSEAKTMSVTLNEALGQLSTILGFQFTVTEFTQTGATTFKVELAMY